MSLDVRDKMHGGSNFGENLNQTKIVNFKKHSQIVVLTCKILYCHQYSGDFIYFEPRARELFYTTG